MATRKVARYAKAQRGRTKGRQRQGGKRGRPRTHRRRRTAGRD